MGLTRHFVQYHNTEKMGYDCADGGPFRIVTNRSVDGLPGNTVWLIAGKGCKPRRFYLCEVFVVNEVGPRRGGGFKFFARGSDGTRFLPRCP
jgi:hypothetical protein